ncbi:hypothetical protein E8E78_20750 [Pseudomonas sp. BN505]|nr:hypothetical protein [Pseudomonas sp. BN605]MDH4859004.1 hypothetical protein [Pseudomonas sp. BN505]NTY90788.1 hypothetical protein [Pseudomonas putida]NTZ02845.1 hypothetical protein [Pseudomonas putida]NTZ21998.1 hypothetical protein [Pseudomonas putida]
MQQNRRGRFCIYPTWNWRDHQGQGAALQPIRGLARSHRIFTALRGCAVPVGAGKPANGAQRAPRNTVTSGQNDPVP